MIPRWQAWQAWYDEARAVDRALGAYDNINPMGTL